MDLIIQKKFMGLWNTYFDGAELPIAFFYGDTAANAEIMKPAKGHSCLICELARVRKGESLAYDERALACGGARRYLGFAEGLRPGFEHFLSCGIPGKMEGERYKKSPEIVLELLKNQKTSTRSGKYIVFKRWDMLEENDRPEVVFFFASPDVLAGLFTLANFDETDPHGVTAPFAAGCGSIVYYPFLEILAERPRAVIGMFDPSARPCVAPGELSFSVPMKKFLKMIVHMEESFLITPTWKAILNRIKTGK